MTCYQFIIGHFCSHVLHCAWLHRSPYLPFQPNESESAPESSSERKSRIQTIYKEILQKINIYTYVCIIHKGKLQVYRERIEEVHDM